MFKTPTRAIRDLLTERNPNSRASFSGRRFFLKEDEGKPLYLEKIAQQGNIEVCGPASRIPEQFCYTSQNELTTYQHIRGRQAQIYFGDNIFVGQVFGARVPVVRDLVIKKRDFYALDDRYIELGSERNLDDIFSKVSVGAAKVLLNAYSSLFALRPICLIFESEIGKNLALKALENFE